MTVRVGVDIGGTFTDFALFEDGADRVLSHKTLTTADAPWRAVIEGLDELLQVSGHRFSDISVLAHGTTLVTNAIIERRGSPTGMLVTRGFADVVDIARENRYELFNLRIHYAPPVVPRPNRIEVSERITHNGTVATVLDGQHLVEQVRSLVDETGIQSLAICFLNSFRNPEHENAARDIVRAHFPDLYLSVSSQTANSIREYERWTTTLLNAYTQPLIDAYLSQLEQELGRRGFGGTLRIMTSSGGAFDAALARALPVRLIESGPAAGILMASHLARQASIKDILAFDIGGTTAKGAFIRNAAPIKKYEMEVAREQQFRPGSGLPVRVPVIDMMEIGSGGGSIVHVDGRGLVAVGPRSASSMPGPACYDRGGVLPTLTDANLALGFLDPDYFLGGKMKLSVERGSEAIATLLEQVAAESVESAAEGIREIAAEDITAAFRTHAAELGLDVRRSTLVAFGGSGPVMATLVARKLRIGKVLFPAGSGVFSAIGLLASPASFEAARSFRAPVGALENSDINAVFESLRGEARDALMGMKVAAGAIRYELILDLRYVGQGHQVRIAVPALPASGNWRDSIRAEFEAVYGRTFSVNVPDTDVETTDWRVVATETHVTAPAMSVMPCYQKDDNRLDGSGRVWLHGKWSEWRKINRYLLHPGDVIEGPALVQEVESTCVLLPGDVGTVLDSGHIDVRIDISSRRLPTN
jgi:N-methylhydantoinase A